ncbi:hypothetical protein Celaphus_00001775 [Cervus elaphus hippelaphus]|uniref:Ig-like domain-containing protein n=1 Tax=Cervus elaphus hippelaphus TaxID=46360 RepID=A0A212CHE8_CEREH|nr:hypothetical protein Celaphus_00001775 [Cervus elaphus hippelaphus]
MLGCQSNLLAPGGGTELTARPGILGTICYCGQLCSSWPPFLSAACTLSGGTLDAPATQDRDLPKAVVSIQPAWINVLREDRVTLVCQGTSFYDGNLTMWFHNGSSIHTQNQPSYSFQAGSNDSGSYRCQREQTSLSDPVHLDDGKSKTFSYQRSNFSIPRANFSHSGKYHCTAFIGKTPHSSQPVNITVQESSSSDPSSSMTVVAIGACFAAVAIVAAVVAWFRLRRKPISGPPEHREMGETLPEEPAGLNDAEADAARTEAENTVTYSLLSHPDIAEEDTESDYQKHL